MHPVDSMKHARLTLRTAVLATIVSLLSMMLGPTAIVRADNVQNDVVAGGTDTITAGGATTISYRITANNGDGQTGCNAADASPASVVINVPVGVSASPGNLTFTSCGTFKPVLMQANAVGNYAITASVSDTGAGTYNTNPATFTLRVLPAPNTPPSVAVSGVTDGASYSKGTVPAAACSVSDAEDGPSSFPATLSAITGPYSADDIGDQTASCSYTDLGGLIDAEEVTYSIVDSSPPAIGYVLSPAIPDGANGWYLSTVTLTWEVTDEDSPSSLQVDGCVNQSIASDQAEQSYTCAATSAGGSAGPVSVSIKRDATAPEVSCDASDGVWHAANVEIACEASDSPSGLSDLSDANFKLTTDVADGIETADAATGDRLIGDNAGNATTAGPVSGNKVDRKPPANIAFVGGPNEGGSYYFGSVPQAPDCTAVDGGSGLAGCTVTGYSSAVGTHTMSATATDIVGNSDSMSRTYIVLAWTANGFYAPVDMNGTVNTVKAGSTVPLKFEVYAGALELTDPAIVKSLRYAECIVPAGAPEDALELTASGGTVLRYDATAGQFIYNWSTKGLRAGTSYTVTVELLDGTKIIAFFTLK
jgi:hypothetical protein